jgi:hypothetical protein
MNRKIIALQFNNPLYKPIPMGLTGLICSKEGSPNFFFDNEQFAFSLGSELREHLQNKTNEEQSNEFFLQEPIDYFQNAKGLYVSQKVFDHIEIEPQNYASFQDTKKTKIDLNFSNCIEKEHHKRMLIELRIRSNLQNKEFQEKTQVEVIREDITYHFAVLEKEEATEISTRILARLNYKIHEKLKNPDTRYSKETYELSDLNYKSSSMLLGKNQMTLEAFLIRGYLSDHKKKLGHLKNVNSQNGVFRLLPPEQISQTIDKLKQTYNFT